MSRIDKHKEMVSNGILTKVAPRLVTNSNVSEHAVVVIILVTVVVNYHLPMKLREGNVLTGVSVHSEVGISGSMSFLGVGISITGSLLRLGS